MASVNLIVYHPKSDAGAKELAQRAAVVHAQAVMQRLKLLNCPNRQKLELLDAVIQTVSAKQ